MSSAKELYESGQYELCINMALRPEEREEFEEWDYVYYSLCLYKMKEYNRYLDLYKEFHAKYPDSILMNDKMGWSLYHTQIKNFEFGKSNLGRLLKQVDFVLDHSGDTKYSPKVTVSEFIIGAIIDGRFSVNINYELLNKYLSKINPKELSNEEVVIEENGKTRFTASKKEKWYMRKTKVLYELGLYDECLQYVEKAFVDIAKFHNNDNYWLDYRTALCFFSKGRIKESKELVLGITEKFKHWCFYEHLFLIERLNAQTESALRYGCLCALTDKNHKLRVKFYENFAEFLIEIGEEYEAALHLKLVELIREEENWKQVKLPEGFDYPEAILGMNKKQILKELQSFWTSNEMSGIDFYESFVKRILPEGKSGFIAGTDGNDYYFNFRDVVENDYGKIKVGVKVKFAVEEKLDKKKGIVKPNAIKISLV